MKVLAISLFLLGIKYLLIVIMTGLGIFIIVTLYNILK